MQALVAERSTRAAIGKPLGLADFEAHLTARYLA
jgi:hypothetical protein